MRQVLIFFFKYPEKGRVKTRLAKDLGRERTYEIYKKVFRKTLSVLKQVRDSSIVLCVDTSSSVKILREEYGHEFPVFLQKGKDLGQRMANAFRTILSERGVSAVLIGADIPGLSKGILEEAFSGLREEHDVVIGPTVDGGYYLIGMKESYPMLFENIVWSTPFVFRDTISIIKSHGLKYRTLTKLRDLDSLEDYKQMQYIIEKNDNDSEKE